MAKKIFTYKGKKLEELQTLSIKELADLFPARQRRKIKRGFSDQEKLFIEKVSKKDNVKTQLRDMIVLPNMVGKTIKVHTGKEFSPVEIQPEMIGHYLGELILTRRKVGHSSPGVGATKSSGSVSVR
ncbi:30S ribosomal protein S19 [Candidatus Woesearchaeota archaeon]|nr:30S ribosomal protein S19 [Candidatus Woesearchaeota archaeon]MCF7901666.1 30S ribosomal protein S19 [Candidatus Woesearchaeota archaeon]MCF8013340.1 30S ribosomal protein S19 [Candidatus Woesearchaeota archaeon]